MARSIARVKWSESVVSASGLYAKNVTKRIKVTQSKSAKDVTSPFVTAVVGSSTLVNSARLTIVGIVPPLYVAHDVALRVAKHATIKDLVVPRARRSLPKRQNKTH